MISIICPIYNKEKYLEETISSVLKQTSDKWELILIDDGSTDNSFFIAKKYANLYDCIVVLSRDDFSKDKKGANVCRNIGARVSSYDWLMFLDADDLLEQGCVQERTNEIKKNNDGSNFIVFRVGYGKGIPPLIYDDKMPDARVIRKVNKKTNDLQEYLLSSFLKFELLWHTSGPVWLKKFYQEIGGFNEKYQRLQDPEIHCRALLSTTLRLNYIAHLKEPDVIHRMDDDRLVWDKEVFFERQMKSIILFVSDFNEYLISFGRRDLKNLLQGYLLFAEMLVYNSRRSDNLTFRDSQDLLLKFYEKTPAELIDTKYSVLRSLIILVSRSTYLVKKRLPGLLVFVYKKYLLK